MERETKLKETKLTVQIKPPNEKSVYLWVCPGNAFQKGDKIRSVARPETRGASLDSPKRGKADSKLDTKMMAIFSTRVRAPPCYITSNNISGLL